MPMPRRDYARRPARIPENFAKAELPGTFLASAFCECPARWIPVRWQIPDCSIPPQSQSPTPHFAIDVGQPEGSRPESAFPLPAEDNVQLVRARSSLRSQRQARRSLRLKALLLAESNPPLLAKLVAHTTPHLSLSLLSQELRSR